MSFTRAPRPSRFTLSELMMVIVVLLFLSWLLLPLVLGKKANKSARVNCAGNLKQVGLAVLVYSGSNGGYFPIANGNTGRNLEPLNTLALLADGKVYACPSASHAYTLARYSNYRYRGSGLRDDNDSATAITMTYDQSGNHPDHQWMNALFLDGHVEGARPDGNKTWNLAD